MTTPKMRSGRQSQGALLDNNNSVQEPPSVNYTAQCQCRNPATKVIQRGLNRIFKFKPEQSLPDDNADSVTDMNKTSQMKAEMLEEDNMAWGSPPRASKHSTFRESGRRDRTVAAPPPYRQFEAEMLDDDNMAWGPPVSRNTPMKNQTRSSKVV